MTNKRLCLPDGNEQNERQGGEENQENNSSTATVIYSETDTCPICLSCLLEQELGFPDNCHHVFCMTCILKWADIVPFCPIDRKPFQAVYRFEDRVKFQVTQNKTTHEKGNCTCDQNTSFIANSKCYIRETSIGPLKPKVFNGIQRKHGTSRPCENEKLAAVKPRTVSCASRCYRSNFNHVHNSGIVTGDHSSSYTNQSHDISELYDTATVIQRKTRTLRSLWSSAVQLRIDGISCTAAGIPADIDTTTALLLSRINFPVSHSPSGKWDSSSPAHIPMCAQDGVEKKKAGASNTRGARKTSESTPPRRRSTRNSRSEGTNQASSPARSSNSGSNAPEGQASSLNTSSADSEKTTPKQSSKREAKKQHPRKKRLRSSVCDPDDSSSSEVAEEEAASEPCRESKSDLRKKPQSDEALSHESDSERSGDQRTPTLEKERTDVDPSPPATANKSSDADVSSVLVNEQLSQVAGSPCSLPASVKELLPDTKDASVSFSEKEKHEETQQSSPDEHSEATLPSKAQESHLEHVSLSPSGKDEPDAKSSALKALPPAADEHILADAVQLDAQPASPVLKKEELSRSVSPLPSVSEKEEQTSIFSVLEKEHSNLEQSPAPPSLEKESQPDTEHPPCRSAPGEVPRAEHSHGSPVLEREQSAEYSKEEEKGQSDCELSPAPPALEKELVELSPASPTSKRNQSDSQHSSPSPTLANETQSDIDLSPAPPALEKEQQSELKPISSAFESGLQADGGGKPPHATEEETLSDTEHSPAPPALEKELHLDVGDPSDSSKEPNRDSLHALPSAVSAKDQQCKIEDLTASLVGQQGPVSEACSSLSTSVKEPQSKIEETLASVLSAKEENQSDVGSLLTSLVTPVEQSNNCLAQCTAVEEQSVSLAPDVDGKSHPELTPSENKHSNEKVATTESLAAKSSCPLPTVDSGVENANPLLECKAPGKSKKKTDVSGGATVSLATVNQAHEAKFQSKRIDDLESSDKCATIAENTNQKNILKSNQPKSKSLSSHEELLEHKPDTDHGNILNAKVISGTVNNASKTLPGCAKLNPPVTHEPLATNIQAKHNEPPALATKKRRKFFSEDNDQMVPLQVDLVNKPNTEEPHCKNVKPEVKSLTHKTVEKTSLVSNTVKDEAQSKESHIVKSLTTEAKEETNKKKESRPRRSRFHSPSTTWNPENNNSERKRSPSPNRDNEPSPKHRARSRSRDKSITRRQSSPILKSRPQNRDAGGVKSDPFSKRKSRSRSKDKDLDKNVPSPKRKSIFQSKDRGGDQKEPTNKRHSRSPSKDQGEQNEPWKEWNRDNRSRRRSRSDSLPRSRSRSKSRTGGMPSLLDRHEKETPAALLSLPLPLPLHPPILHSHQWDRWSNDNWRGNRGKRHRRNEYDYQDENFRHESNDFNRAIDDSYPQFEGRNEYPDWEMDRRHEDHQSRDRQPFRGSQWEDDRYNTGDDWSRNSNSGWNTNHNQGGHSKFVERFDYGHQSENRWRCRQPVSGNSNDSENESTEIVESRPYRHKNEKEYFDAPPDRSGWTSASSWAVRKTLPADVQNYYSKRGKNSSTPQGEWADPDSGNTMAEPEYKAADSEHKVAPSEYTETESEYTSKPKQTEPEWTPSEPKWTSSEPEWTVRNPEWVAQESEWTTKKPEWTAEEPEWKPPQSEWTEPQAGWTEPQAGWNKPQAEWNKPQAEWTEPQAEWTEPQAEWTEPQAEWNKPQAEWNKPQAEWNKPQAEWNKPQAEWNKPQAEWNKPQAEWNKPQAEWNRPQDEWTKQQDEWTKPQAEWITPQGEWPRTQPDWTKPPPDWTKPPPDWTHPPPDWTNQVDETPEQDQGKSVAKDTDVKEPRASEGKSWIRDVEPNIEEQRNLQDDGSKMHLEMLPPPPPPPPRMNIMPQQITAPHQHAQPQINATHQDIQPQTNTAHHAGQTQMNTPHHPVQQQINMPHHTTQPQMNASPQSVQPQMNTPPQPIQQQMNAAHQPMQHLNAPHQPMQPQMNTLPLPMQQQINASSQPMNLFPYPIGVHAPMMNIPHNPYAIPPPLHMQLPPGMPLLQVAAASTAAQDLPPPPPPPPPPPTQGNFNTAQPEGKKLLENIGQVRQITLTPVTTVEKVNPSIPLVSNNMLTLLLPATPAAVGNTGAVAGSSSIQAPLTMHNRPSNTAKSLAGNKVTSTAPHSGNAKNMSNLPPPAPPVGSKGNVRGPTSSNVSSANHSNPPPVAIVAGHKVNNPPLHVSNNMSTSHVPPPPPAPPVGNKGAVQGPSSSSMSASSHSKHIISSLVSGQKILHNAPHMSNTMKFSNAPTQSGPTAKVATVQGPSSSNTSHQNTSKPTIVAAKMSARKESIAVETRDDGYQVDKKVQIQERAAYEVKVAIKPYYQSKDITKDEYKEIVRKAVDKVCHSKSGDVNSAKVANLVRAYVDKYKHARKEKE
ncbi:protein SCAF11 [Lissotriton helveticus]